MFPTMSFGIGGSLICEHDNAATREEIGMPKVAAGITTSFDGYITGPNDGPERGLGEGGERLHYWVFGGPWTYAEPGRGDLQPERQAVDRRTHAVGVVREVSGRDRVPEAVFDERETVELDEEPPLQDDREDAERRGSELAPAAPRERKEREERGEGEEQPFALRQ